MSEPPPDQPPPPPPMQPPPPPAEQAPDHYRGDKWEYRIITYQGGQWALRDLQEQLNEYGAHGFEVIGLTSMDRMLARDSLEILMKRRIIPG